MGTHGIENSTKSLELKIRGNRVSNLLLRLRVGEGGVKSSLRVELMYHCWSLLKNYIQIFPPKNTLLVIVKLNLKELHDQKCQGSCE